MGPKFSTRAESEALLRQQSPPWSTRESTMWLKGVRLLTFELRSFFSFLAWLLWSQPWHVEAFEGLVPTLGRVRG